jgi:hypothetical protein
MRWTRHAERMGANINSYSISVGTPEGRRLLEKPKHVLEYIIKVELTEIGWEHMEWIHTGQDREQWLDGLVNTVMNHRVP